MRTASTRLLKRSRSSATSSAKDASAMERLFVRWMATMSGSPRVGGRVSAEAMLWPVRSSRSGAKVTSASSGEVRMRDKAASMRS